MLIGVTVKLNRKFDCKFGVLNGANPELATKGMLLNECYSSDGERFNWIVTKVVDCEIHVIDPFARRGCLLPG